MGLDPTRDWLPVAPAAHYLSGGVCTDLDGATTLPGLWACGEAACSGVHGANRLASNSLLEGLVFARARWRPSSAVRTAAARPACCATRCPNRSAVPRGVTTTPGPAIRHELQRIMSRDAGRAPERRQPGRAPLTHSVRLVPTDVESANLLAVSTVLVRAATARRESRGTHTRQDYPRAVGRVPRPSGLHGRTVTRVRAAGDRARAVAMSARGEDRDDERLRPARPRRAGAGVRARSPRTSGRSGDLTAALVPAEATATVDVVARADGVIAGTACATEVFAQLDPRVAVGWLVDDGDAVGRGAKLGEVSGPLRSVLTGERTALNFLCHLSGVATLTRRFVEAAGPTRARIWDTRKTLPGLRALEKAAVRAGGGVNHRGSLSDFVLVKDNHLAGLGITAAVAAGPGVVAGAHGRGRVRPARRRCRRRSRPGRRWSCSTT